MMPQRRRSDSDRKESEASKEWPTLARQNEKRAALLEKTARGVAIFDAEERLVDCNRIFAEIHGLPPQLCARGTKFGDIIAHQVDAGNIEGVDPETYVATHFNMIHAKAVASRVEHLPDGRVISVGHLPVDSGGWMTTYDDVSDLYAVKDELEHSAFYDRRTALPNRRLLMQCLDEAFMESWDEDYFAVTHIQLRNSDALCDQLGQDGMHDLIKQIATRLRNGVRKDDLPTKLEGHHFAVLQQGVTCIKDSTDMAQRIVTVLHMPFKVAETTIMAEFALGIALPLDVDEDEASLLEKARQASQHAAMQSGQRYSVHASIPIEKVA